MKLRTCISQQPNSIKKSSLTPFLLAFALTACLFAPERSAAAGSKPTQPAGESDALFSQPEILRLKIEIPEANLASLKKEPKTYVRAKLREGGEVYSETGIRYKGGDLSRADEKKPSFNVKFNEFDQAQRFHGQRKITLDNSSNDPTYLAEILASELFRAGGVPAPRCTFAIVELNGRDLGLYVLAEGVNRDFLSRYFDMTKGNLYEGDHNDITDKLDKDSGDNRTDQPDLAALAEAANETKPARRWKPLEQVLDTDRFLSFVALEVITWHPEGYAIKAGKYRIYHNPATDRMVFMPHGLERCFTRGDGPLMPAMGGLVARAMLQNAEGERRLRQRISELLTKVFRVDALHARMDQWVAKIRPVLVERDPAAGKTFDEEVARLRERIAQRAGFLEEQLHAASKARRK